MFAVPTSYTYACGTSDIPLRGKKSVEIDGLIVLLIASDEGLFATEDRCPQTGRSIVHGEVLGHIITTPTTGAQYDLRTGRYLGGGQSPLQSHWLTVFQVRIIDNDVYIKLTL